MDINTAKEALKKYFGYPSFRPMQESIIQTLLAGRDALVLMPTGGGKSLCYQIPAIILPGTCLVVSPLIALMKDQVEGLRQYGVKAAFLNSSLTPAEQQKVEDAFFNDELEILYLSPEKITSSAFLPLLQPGRINLVAIDEAHCISAWGHDFRPEYTKLKFLKEKLPNTPFVALTATADKLTRRDIQQQLALDDPEVFIASFDRPNLSLEVRPGQKRFEQILAFIQARPDQPGIIYCLSRKRTEEIAQKLTDRGIPAAAYHAGLSASDRAAVQERFINDTTPIVCATIAFGMGIDKSNVRWVIHYNLPKNLESYYQEIGRAGRDGVKAETILFYSFQDVALLRNILSDNESEQTEVQLTKLERMRQYAESLACRRRIVLSYLGETMEKDCGNCDVCQNPPQYFDGTIIAQKALSAAYRLGQKVPAGILIDVLRGAQRREILQNNYHLIKTYGAGRDLSTYDWQQYLQQLLNLGYLEVAYDKSNAIQLTPAAEGVLKGHTRIQLVKTTNIRARQQADKEAVKKRAHQANQQDDLFQVLRQIRKKLAQEFGIPPYQIFNDATLKAMVELTPVTDEDMLEVPGVGERKLQRYGDYFIDAIIDFRNKKKGTAGSTHLLTLDLFRKGLSPGQIAEKRQLNVSTIISHLAQLYEKGTLDDLDRLLPEAQAGEIAAAVPYVQQPPRLKDLFEYFSEKYDYDTLRLGLAYYQRRQ